MKFIFQGDSTMRALLVILMTVLLSGCGYNDFQKNDEQVKGEQ